MTDELSLATFAGAAWITTKIVERVRVAWPALNGAWVNLIAVAVGVAIAFGAGTGVIPALTPYTWVLDRIIVGFGLGAGAGWLADVAGRSGPRSVK